MSNIGDLIAFRAALELCRDAACHVSTDEIYRKCVAQQSLPEEQIVNYAADIYKPFSDEDISRKITELIHLLRFLENPERDWRKNENNLVQLTLF